jgi:hypothetical protein
MKRGTHVILSGLLFVVETAIAFGVFFGAAYGLTRLAEYRANAPVIPQGEGAVVLSPSKATLYGELNRYPTEWEERTEGYGNEFGRALAEERRNRKIGNWKSVDDAAEWEFCVDPGGKYRVEVELSAPPEEAGSQIEAKIGPKTIVTTVPDTGGWDKWKQVKVGRVTLDAGTHSVVLKATTVENEAVMNVRRVVLRPLE